MSISLKSVQELAQLYIENALGTEHYTEDEILWFLKNDQKLDAEKLLALGYLLANIKA